MVDIPGNQAGALATNRRFWDDPFVEPKQQHRFGVNFPVYMNMGAEDSSALAALYLKHAGSSTTTITTSTSDDEDGSDFMANTANVRTITTTTNSGLRDLRVTQTANFTNFGTKADGKGKGGLYMRISEYIGYSFTPPPLGYEQGYLTGEGSEAGSARPDPGNNTYTIGDATLVFVTTLRDDLHFSLNFLFALSFQASGAEKTPVRLFPEQVCGSGISKTLVIKEYSARPDTKPGLSKYNAAPESMEGIEAILDAAPRVVGLHKINDPVIKSATFDPFTYGATDLVKVTLTLGYGAPDQGGGLADFYSYQATTSRYQKSYFTWEGEPLEDPVPSFNLIRKELRREYPNFSSGHDAASVAQGNVTETAAAIRKRLRQQSLGPNKERTDLIRDRMEEGDVTKINEMVSKSIQTLLDEKAAAEAQAAEERLAREARAAEDGTFEEQINREADETRQRLRESEERNRLYGPESNPQHLIDEEAAAQAAELDRNLAAPHGNAHLNRGGSGQDFNPFRRTAPEFVEPAFTDQQSAARRQISRLSNNQSSAGSNVSEFGKED